MATLRRIAVVLGFVAASPCAVASDGGVEDVVDARASDAPLARAAARHRRILLIGESSIQFHLGAELERLFETSYEGLTVERFGKASTSLTRSRFFNWPQKLEQLLVSFRPELVIANFGGNDAQNVIRGGVVLRFGSDEWDQEYGRRLELLIDLVRSHGADFVLIGMPAMRMASFSSRMEHLNRLMHSRVEAKRAVFLSVWDLSTTAQGEFREAVTLDGDNHALRLRDGMHYSQFGGAFVAAALAERLEQHFCFIPSDPGLGIALPRSGMSAALGDAARYVVYLPRVAALGHQRVPVLFLLQGSDDSEHRWSERAHRRLQELSNAYQLMMVSVPAHAGGSLDAAAGGSKFENYLIDELVPEVDRSLPSNGLRAIAGSGDAANGVVRLALEHPALFESASAMGSASQLLLPGNEMSFTWDVRSGVSDWDDRVEMIAAHVFWHARELRRLSGGGRGESR